MSSGGQVNSQPDQLSRHSDQLNRSNQRPMAEPMPSPTAGLSSDVATIFQKSSPLQLLNLQGAQPQGTPAILDPQKVANDIAVQRELDRIEADKRSIPSTATLNGSAPPTSVVSVTDSAQVPPIIPASDTQKTFDGLSELDKALDGKTEETPKIEEQKATSSEGEEDPLADIPDDPKAENFKRLRERTKDYSSRLKTIQKEHEETRHRLTEYETGAVMPDVLKEKDERIAQLEPLEKIHSLKTSPEYRNKFITPLNHIGSQLQDLGDRYTVQPEAVHHALGIRNERDLDEFLVDQFGNTIGASQAKQLIQNAQRIQDEAFQAEAQPQSAMQQLQLEAERTRVAEEAERVDSIKHTARSSWMDAVNQIREEGTAKELIPGDMDHNNRFVTPIQTAASREYGKLIVAISEAGAKHIAPEVGKALARMSLLAHTSAVNQARAMAAEAYIAELEKSSERLSRIERPSLSGRNGTGSLGGAPVSNPAAPRPADPTSMARQQLQDLGLAGRR